MARVFLVLVVLAALTFSSEAKASSGCEANIKPSMSGFFMNPTVNNVMIVEVAPPLPGQSCKLQVGDEILKINDQSVRGRKAIGLMKYFKSIKPTDPKVYTVRRGDETLVVDVRK